MFLIDKDSNVITLTRGDTCAFAVEIKTDTGETYTPQEGDIVTFTMKKDTKTSDIIIQKTGSTIVINPADTRSLKYGSYLYDVTLTTASKAVYTIITPTEFIIAEECNFEET